MEVHMKEHDEEVMDMMVAILIKATGMMALMTEWDGRGMGGHSYGGAAEASSDFHDGHFVYERVIFSWNWECHCW